MEIAHILEELAYDMGELPRDAIEAAVAKRAQIAPYLIGILEDAVLRVDEIIEHEDYQGHLYAMYLLAQFREKAAYPLIIKLISYPGEVPHAMTGDVLTEDLCRILASVCGGDSGPIENLIENPNINEYVRVACLSSLVTLVGCGLKSRNQVIDYFRTLLEEKLEREYSFVWDNLALCCCDLYPEEVYHSLARAFNEKLIDSTFISLEDIGAVLTERKESHLFHLFQNAELIDDTVSETEKWLSSHP